MLLNPKLPRSQTQGNIECVTDQLTQYEGLLTNIRNDLFWLNNQPTDIAISNRLDFFYRALDKYQDSSRKAYPCIQFYGTVQKIKREIFDGVTNFTQLDTEANIMHVNPFNDNAVIKFC